MTNRHPKLGSEWGTDKRQIWNVLKRSSEEANRLKIDNDFVQSYWSAWENK